MVEEKEKACKCIFVSASLSKDKKRVKAKNVDKIIPTALSLLPSSPSPSPSPLLSSSTLLNHSTKTNLVKNVSKRERGGRVDVGGGVMLKKEGKKSVMILICGIPNVGKVK